MKIDEITDVETLRELAKTCRTRVMKDCKANDGSDFIFKSGEWYMASQDEDGVTLYSEEEPESTLSLPYEEIEIYLQSN